MRRVKLSAAVVAASGLAAGVYGQLAPVVLAPANRAPQGGGVTHYHTNPRTGEIIGCGKYHAALALEAAGAPFDGGEGTGEANVETEALTATDLLHCNAEIELIPGAAENIRGSNIMTVRSLVNGLTQFTFNLRSQYIVENAGVVNRVLLNGTTPAVVTTPPADNSSYARRVTLDRAYNAGEIFTVRVAYRGLAANVGFGSISFGTQGGVPMVSTLSQPYYAGTWWPVKDGDVRLPGDNIDKFTLDMAVIVPSTLRGVSNGVLQGVDALSGSRSRYRWRTNYLIPTYLVAIGATNYNTYTTNWNYTPSGGSPIVMPFEINLFPASDTATNRNAWNRSVQMLTVFSDLYGVYPFANEKYGMYQTQFSGGMEHQTNTAQGVFNESVTAHELAHQWLGDLVTCRYWNDIWLNEGGASYGESLWEERKNGGLNAAALRSAMLARKPAANSGSVYKYTTTSVSALFESATTYNKAGWVYHMLRGVVGDATFQAILAEWRARYAFSAADTLQFRQVCEDVSGLPFGQFFDQWVFGTGEVAYQSGFQNVNVDGQNYVRLLLNQSQSTTFGAGSKFVMPVRVRISTGAGVVNAVVQNDNRQEWYLIPVPAAATSVAIDPDDWILTASKAATAYVQGPAKVLSVSPAPGSVTVAAAGLSGGSVRFSDNVNINASNVELTGPSGVVPVSVSYNASGFLASLGFGGDLPAGEYTLRVRDTVTTAAGAVRLDGEVADPASSASLPSGDGQPLGDAVFTFRVRCTADVNNDNSVDLSDFFEFFNAYDVEGAAADVTGDGTVDLADFFAFFGGYDAEC